MLASALPQAPRSPRQPFARAASHRQDAGHCTATEPRAIDRVRPFDRIFATGHDVAMFVPYSPKPGRVCTVPVFELTSMKDMTAVGEDRFESVEALSSQIFDQLKDPERNDTEIAEPDRPNVPSPGTDRSMLQRSWALLVVLAKLDEPRASDVRERDAKPRPTADISFHAARDRIGLPKGIELLESAPEPVHEETTNAAIRKVMIEQKRTQSLAKLPPLTPPEEFDPPEPTHVQPRRLSLTPKTLVCWPDPLLYCALAVTALVFSLVV